MINTREQVCVIHIASSEAHFRCWAGLIVYKLISASHSYTATSYLDAIPADIKADLSKPFSDNLYLGRSGFSYRALRRS